MTVELTIVISAISLIFGIMVGWANMRRNHRQDDRTEASALTTVIVKLESIGNGVSEIKSEMQNVKEDIKENRERIIAVEASAKQAHKRMDEQLAHRPNHGSFGGDM